MAEARRHPLSSAVLDLPGILYRCIMRAPKVFKPRFNPSISYTYLAFQIARRSTMMHQAHCGIIRHEGHACYPLYWFYCAGESRIANIPVCSLVNNVPAIPPSFLVIQNAKRIDACTLSWVPWAVMRSKPRRNRVGDLKPIGVLSYFE